MEGQETFMKSGEELPEVRRGRGWNGGKNLPTYDANAGTGDNTKFIKFIIEERKMPKIDTSDPEQVAERINWYFGMCADNDMRPTVSGMASALGVSRKTVWSWHNGIGRPQNYEIVEEAYTRLEELWELYMMHGKIHPANGIFLGKNHFGYKDVQDVVVTPNNPLGDVIDLETIEERYEELPEG